MRKSSRFLKEQLNKLIEQVNFDREKKISEVTKIYNKLKIQDIVKQRIIELNERALNYLKQVPVEENKKSELKKLAEKLINRIN